MKIPATVLLLAFAPMAMAAGSEIPLSEDAFVESMKTASKADIIAQLGEPEKITDIRDDITGEVFGSVWHYHYLNTAENGDYYRTTMLDIVDDNVVTVVFSAEEK